MILLDTDHLTVLKYVDSIRCEALLARIKDARDDQTGTTIINVEEQMRGWLASIGREKQVDRQTTAYRELAGLFKFYEQLYLALFDDAAAEQFKMLRASKVRIGTMDLKIASISMVNNALLLTANHGDFSQVPGLNFENWLD